MYRRCPRALTAVWSPRLLSPRTGRLLEVDPSARFLACAVRRGSRSRGAASHCSFCLRTTRRVAARGVDPPLRRRRLGGREASPEAFKKTFGASFLVLAQMFFRPQLAEPRDCVFLTSIVHTRFCIFAPAMTRSHARRDNGAAPATTSDLHSDRRQSTGWEGGRHKFAQVRQRFHTPSCLRTTRAWVGTARRRP